MKGAVAMEPVDWCFISIRRMQPVGLGKMSSTKNSPEFETNEQRSWYFPRRCRYHGFIKKIFGVNHSGANILRDITRSADISLLSYDFCKK